MNQREQRLESEWESVSRSYRLGDLSQEKKDGAKLQLEQEVRLKTILTDGYFGQDGVLRPRLI